MKTVSNWNRDESREEFPRIAVSSNIFRAETVPSGRPIRKWLPTPENRVPAPQRQPIGQFCTTTRQEFTATVHFHLYAPEKGLWEPWHDVPRRISDAPFARPGQKRFPQGWHTGMSADAR